MPNEPGVEIRKFTAADRQEVRDIAYATAFIGEPASNFFAGKKIITDALTLYFTDYEPESSFVAEADGKVAGYLIGTKNKALSDKITNRKIIPRLLTEALLSGFFFKKKNIIFIYKVLAGVISGEFSEPDFAREYPATLHINIKEGYRGLNIGSRLISAYLNYLKEERVAAVHLATMSDRAGEFFQKQGFNLLYQGKRSYFRHILRGDIPLYIYGRKL